MMRATWTILALFWRAAGRPMLLGGLLALITALAGVALLGLSGWFITATGIAGAVTATALAFDVFRPGAGVRGLAILRTGARYGERLVTHAATLSVIAALRVRLFRALARPGLALRLTRRPGRLLFRLSGDLDALDGLYLRLLTPLGTMLGTALAVGLGVALIDGRLGLALGLLLFLTGVGLPLILVLRGRFAGGMRAAALEALRLRLLDLVAGRVEWRMAGRGAAMADLTLRADRRLRAADERLNRLDVGSGLAQGVIAALIWTGVLIAVAMGVEAGRIGAAQAALVLLVVLSAQEVLTPLRRGAVELGRTLRAARRVADDLRPLPPPAATASPAAGLAMQLTGVRLRHQGAAAPLFDGLSLSAPVGQHLALIGASGAGKSSLIQMLTGELTPEAGWVATLPWTMLGQHAALFRDDVAANLRLADPAAGEEALWAALRQAGLERVVRDLPAGLATALKEGGAGLSAGQRRRLALARFLMQDKPLWILDEVTEGLDVDVAGEVLTKIKAMAAERTIVLVTHLRREAALADRIVRLQAGRVVLDVTRGTPAFEEALQSLRPD